MYVTFCRLPECKILVEIGRLNMLVVKLWLILMPRNAYKSMDVTSKRPQHDTCNYVQNLKVLLFFVFGYFWTKLIRGALYLKDDLTLITSGTVYTVWLHLHNTANLFLSVTWFIYHFYIARFGVDYNIPIICIVVYVDQIKSLCNLCFVILLLKHSIYMCLWQLIIRVCDL